MWYFKWTNECENQEPNGMRAKRAPSMSNPTVHEVTNMSGIAFHDGMFDDVGLGGIRLEGGRESPQRRNVIEV
jgi:hypothetical protein